MTEDKKVIDIENHEFDFDQLFNSLIKLKYKGHFIAPRWSNGQLKFMVMDADETNIRYDMDSIPAAKKYIDKRVELKVDFKPITVYYCESRSDYSEIKLVKVNGPTKKSMSDFNAVVLDSNRVGQDRIQIAAHHKIFKSGTTGNMKAVAMYNENIAKIRELKSENFRILDKMERDHTLSEFYKKLRGE